MLRGVVDSKPFGEELLVLLTRRGLSQRKFAQAADLDPTYVNRIIKGTVGRPDPETIRKMADGLDLPYRDLALMAGYPSMDVPSGESPPTERPRWPPEVDAEELSDAQVIAAIKALPGRLYQLEIAEVERELGADTQAFADECRDIYRAWRSNAYLTIRTARRRR